MSDYVPDQDFFDQFLQEGDWVNPEATWTNGRSHSCLNRPGDHVHGWEVSPFTREPGFTRPTGTSELSLFGSAHQLGDLDADSFQDLWLDDFDHILSGARGPTQHNSRLPDGNYKPISSLDVGCEKEQGESANHHVQGMATSEGAPQDTMELEDSSESQADRSGVGEETRTNMSSKDEGYREQLSCTFPGCTRKEAFRRQFELNRHMKKHTRNISYGCPIAACNRRGLRAFYREDKLKAHIRSVHEDFEQSLCPVSSCVQGPLQFDLLRVHLHAHVDNQASEIPLLKSTIKFYRLRAECRCPVEKCRVGRSRWMPSDKIPGPEGHLMLHDEGERQEQRASIASKGYDAASGSLICPICKHFCPEERDFRRHLGDAHMTVTEHARLYVDAIRSCMSEDGTNEDQWHIWAIPYSLKETIQCPACPLLISNRYPYRGPLDHPGLITPTGELYTHRREILRILPDFYRHPVFDDVRRT